jgi:hypothetical protein
MMTLRELRSHHWLHCRINRRNALNARLQTVGKPDCSMARNYDQIADFHFDAVDALDHCIPSDGFSTASEDGADNPILQEVEKSIETLARMIRMKKHKNG